ncbi:MAG: tetratricopeptide repeat protein [bacterium]|nr:tetratricopeptide repeat protein [bacterium]
MIKKITKKIKNLYSSGKDDHTDISVQLMVIYRLQQAGKYNQAFEIANELQFNLINQGEIFIARNILEEFPIEKLNESNQAHLLHSTGVIEYEQKNYEEAEICYSRSLEIFEKQNDINGIAVSQGEIGTIYFKRGEYEQALSCYNKSLETFNELQSTYDIGISLYRMAIIYRVTGDYDRAISCYKDCMEIFRELGDKQGLARTSSEIGMIYQEKEDYDRAMAFYKQSLQLSKELGVKQNTCYCYQQIGNLHFKREEYEEALLYFRKCLEGALELGDDIQVATLHGRAGLLNVVLEKYTRALECFIQSYTLFKKLGSPDIRIVVNEILNLKNYIDKKDFNKSLKKAGIKLNELTREPEETDIKTLTIQALQSSDEVIEIVTMLIKSMPEEVKTSSKGKDIFAYYQFLLDLTRAGNKETFLEKADTRLVENMEMFLTEESSPEEEAPVQADKDTLGVLTFDAYVGNKDVIKRIENVIANIPKKARQSNETKEFCAILQFLRELVSTKNRNEFLKKADREMLRNISSILFKSGLFRYEKKDFEQAIAHFRKSLEISEELEDKDGMGNSFHQIGMIYHETDDYKQAYSCYQHSLKFKEEQGDKTGIASSKIMMGLLNLKVNDFSSALDCFIHSYILLKQIGTPYVKVAEKKILYMKRLLEEKDYNESLSRAGINPAELSPEEEA